MIVNRYQKEQSIRYKVGDFLEKLIPHREIRYKKKTMDFVNNGLIERTSRGIDVFHGELKYLEVETINRCNGECPFCPVNRHTDPRKPQLMSEQLFDKIIRDLRNMRYKGYLELYSNNEPLLDKRLYDFAVKARNSLSEAKLRIYTNGTLLDEPLCERIVSVFDKIVVDCYSDDLKIPEHLFSIYKRCEIDDHWNQVIEIHLRKQHEILSTRGGQAPNNETKKIRKIPCQNVLHQMVIRPDGKVSLCSCDPLGKVTLGDVKDASILDIWDSISYSDMRKEVTYHPEQNELCRYCDMMWGEI